MAIKAGFTLAEWIARLTKGYKKATGRQPDGLAKLKIKMEAADKVRQQNKILKPDFGKGDTKRWTKAKGIEEILGPKMDEAAVDFVRSTDGEKAAQIFKKKLIAQNKEAAYNMALKRYRSVDRRPLSQKQIENIYRDLAKDSRGREIILRDIGEIEKREMFTTMGNQMRQDILSKLRGLSYKPNPFKNKPTGKKDPNWDPDPTGMASGGRTGLSNGGPIDPSNYGIFPQIPGGLPFPDLDSYDSDYKKLIKKKKKKEPSDFNFYLDKFRRRLLPKGDFVEKEPSDFDPHLEDLMDLLYREKDKNKFKIEKAPYVYDEDDLPWWMEPYRENDSIDVGPAEIKVASGGRVGMSAGGILGLLELIINKFGKKAITTADKIKRPEKALLRDKFKAFNERNRKLTKDELDDLYEEFDEAVPYPMETVADKNKFLKSVKDEEAYMLQQYKMGKLEPKAGEVTRARLDVLRKRAEDAELTKDFRLFGPDERAELDYLEDYFAQVNKESPWFTDSKTLTPEDELRKEFPGIDDNMIKNILADTNPQRIAEVKQTMREALKMQEKGMSPDEIIKIFKDTTRTKQASGGIAGQLHLNQGGRAGFANGSGGNLPTVESLGGRPNVEGGEIVYNLGNGQYIYKSSQGFELVDENGVYTSLGAHQWTDEEGITHGWENLDDLLKYQFPGHLDSGTVMRHPNDPVLKAQQQTAPATLTAQAPATNMVNEEISWEPGQAAPEGYEVKRALGDEWIQRVEPSMPPVGPVELPPGVPGLMGPVPPAEMMPPVLPIPPEQAATMEATPTGLTSVTPQKTVTQNPLVDPRMYRSYEQNIQLMGDPRMPQASGGLAKILGV